MNTTAESSMPHVPALAYLPVETQVFLFNRDDERLRLQAELAQAKAQLARQRKAQAANGKHAGATRSATKRAATLAMAEQHLPQLQVLTGQHERAEFIRNQIKSAIKLDGEQFMGLTKPPNWRTIDKYIKSLQM